MIIAITGTFCSGKSSVAKMFSELGAKVIDADKIGHELLEKNEVKKKITKAFGKKILDRNKKIDREKLGEMVFSSKNSLDRINRIIHPLMAKEIERQAKSLAKKENIAVIDAALVSELKINNYADRIVKVISARDIKMERAVKKGFAEEYAENILKMQNDVEIVDYMIDNNKTLKDTEKQVKALWQRINK